jgi:uncharacterized protein
MRTSALLSVILISTMSSAASAQFLMSVPNMSHRNISDAPVITLSVTGVARAKPDRAVLNAGVQTKAVSAADAMAQNAKQMQAVLAALKAKSVADKDIQTSRISLTQDYEYTSKGRVFNGYVANNSLSVRMKDISKVGSVLDTLVNAGATDISGPTFMVENDAALTEAARADAMAQAASYSAFYAKNAGFRKARLQSISENRDFGRAIPMANMRMSNDAAAPSGDTPIEPGEVASQISITVTYVLEN